MANLTPTATATVAPHQITPAIPSVRPMRPILPTALDNRRANLWEDEQLQLLQDMMNQHTQLLLQTLIMAKAKNMTTTVLQLWEQLQNMVKKRDVTRNIKAQPFLSVQNQYAFTYFDVPILEQLHLLQPLITEEPVSPQALKDFLRTFEEITGKKQPIDTLLSKKASYLNASLMYQHPQKRLNQEN